LSYAEDVRAPALLLTSLLVAASARAEDPVIHVRARMRIDVDTIERIPDGVAVRGFLRDEAGDEPIAGRSVTIRLESATAAFEEAQISGADGSFRFRAPLPLGEYRLHLVAGGDADYVSAPRIDRTLDVAKRTPTLTLTVPERLPATAPQLHVIVEGRERDDCPGDVACPAIALQGELGFLRIAGHGRSVIGFVEGRAELDELGPFGRAGQRIDVVAEVRENAWRNSVSVRRSILLTSATFLVLNTSASEISVADKVTFTGWLRDEAGPVGGARIGIGLENGPDVADTVTNDDGLFHVIIKGRSLGRGDAFVEARFHPADDWREPSVSPTVALHIAGEAPVASWPYVVSPLCTLLIGGVWLAARDRRWRRWLVRKARRGRKPVVAPSVGLTESRPTLFSSLRGRADHGLTGVVVDAADDRPLPTAIVIARAANGEARAAPVDLDGKFAFEDLPPGPLVVSISAPGYVAERFSRTLPHRGELRGARVRLIPVRARIYAAWQRAARPLHAVPRAFDTCTPRELLAHVSARSILPTEILAELTALVETAVWGAPAPGDEELAAAERLVISLSADPTRRS
jgi:hypothetical protein